MTVSLLYSKELLSHLHVQRLGTGLPDGPNWAGGSYLLTYEWKHIYFLKECLHFFVFLEHLTVKEFIKWLWK